MQKTVKHGDEFGHMTIFSTVPSFVDILDDPPLLVLAPRTRAQDYCAEPQPKRLPVVWNLVH